MPIINAASPSRDDVNTAVQLAGPGDTVVIPAGTANWTNGIIWTAPDNVTLIAAGNSTTGGGNLTVIQDHYASGSPLINITIPSSGVFRMSGITIQSGTGSIKDGGTVRFNGPGLLRIDHCRFNATNTNNYKILYLWNGVFGVMYESIIDLFATCAIYAYNGRDAGEGQGNLEWSMPTNFGNSDYFFIEDCIINGSASSTQTRIFDGNNGAKMVVRFNSVVNSCLAEQHATGHSNDDRGSRSMEIYGNSTSSTIAGVEPNNAGIDFQGGTALAWGNSIGGTYKILYKFDVIRRAGMSGGSPYNQSATPNGWGYAGTAFNGTGSMWDGGTFNGTDTVLGYPCLDQPGRGEGDLITGSFPTKVNDTTGTISWPNQELEPIYIFANTGAVVSGWGGFTIADQSAGRVVSDRDYYYDQAAGEQTSPSSPFDGTSGVGWGTLANRPTTCTPGVAYFATDQGSWNQSASNPYGVQMGGASGVLYKCDSTDIWTEYYEPYTYPHPLRLGAFTENPVFSPVGGEYEGNQVVEITTDTDGATIRYTLDGSTPSSSHGTIYSTAIGVAEDLTIKAIAYKEGLTDSSVVEAVYVITQPGGGGGGVSANGLTANLITLGG